MAFTQDQVNQAYRDSLAQGFSAADIAAGAGNLGIDPYMLQLAATASTPAPEGIPQGSNPAYASGYGGWQPEGSKYYGDSPMPEDYMRQLPQLDASTQNAVNLALQRTLAQAQGNGYAPDQSNVVQTLRGYFSDDPKLRGEAIRQASLLLGGGETNDYGYSGIRGYENQATTTPTFSTAFDPNWNRPTLYDMINSTYGWDAQNNNFADPASRDASLNRRLTDAEISAFQNGTLSSDMMGTIRSYGGATNGGQAGGQGRGGGQGGGGLLGGGALRAPQPQPLPAQSSVNLQAYQKNPYLDEMAQGIRRQVTNNLTDTVLPGVRSNAIASGGFGGSRQGVAEGLAISRTNDALSSALANLYGSDYQAQMNRNLQQYGIDNQTSLGWAANALGNKQADNSYSLGLGNLGLGNKQADNSYNLGMGNLGLGYANLDRNINNDNNSWALQGANLLNSTWNQLNSNNAGAINAGGNIQNTPINYWQQFGNQANAFGQGYGTSTQGTSAQGSPLLGAAGGWQLGGQLWNMFGGSANAAGGANSQGWGTGAGFGNQDYGAYF